MKEAEETIGRIVVIVCDGAQGSCGRLLGISDECIQHSCNTYGAIASLERNCERQEVSDIIDVVIFMALSGHQQQHNNLVQHKCQTI